MRELGAAGWNRVLLRRGSGEEDLEEKDSEKLETIEIVKKNKKLVTVVSAGEFASTKTILIQE